MYDDLYESAAGIVRNQWSKPALQPTELVNECFLKLFSLDRINLNDRSHLLAIAATVMRQILIDQYRREHSGKRHHQAVTLVTDHHSDATVEIQFEALD